MLLWLCLPLLFVRLLLILSLRLFRLRVLLRRMLLVCVEMRPSECVFDFI